MKVQLPDGSIADFPDDMPNAEIEAALRERFPPPQPTSLKPDERAQRKNACVVYNEEFGRYAVNDNAGKLCGFRSTLVAAIDFADSILPPPPPRRKPKAEPQPDSPADRLTVDLHFRSEVDRSIRRQESRERREARQPTRRRNRGTLG